MGQSFSGEEKRVLRAALGDRLLMLSSDRMKLANTRRRDEVDDEIRAANALRQKVGR